MENETSIFVEVYLAKFFLIGNSRKYIYAKLKNFAISRPCESFPE